MKEIEKMNEIDKKLKENNQKEIATLKEQIKNYENISNQIKNKKEFESENSQLKIKIGNANDMIRKNKEKIIKLKNEVTK